MYNHIFELLSNLFLNQTPDPASAEYLFVTGCSLACCLAVVLVPVAVVFTVFKLFTRG